MGNTAHPTDAAIAAVLTDLALRRGRGKSFCPSEAAKALAADWRPLMGEVRRVAAGHPDVVATQNGVPVDPVAARGPIRLTLRDSPAQ
ncbi:DUF3253 domain-containing protein [Paragemmobacter ruber]|uniref:DUF3253 domain-containing protein n=1 Tax=Paragemmobacter ruber TaxID=1985673 RepID=A0ABW9Y5D4_9RHOB|nr:DUF3253 domain-containing protein [Rhodobacter ruber]NBE07718.1 DUF3253 domain-containing protein [Rhodobacter ruber]